MRFRKLTLGLQVRLVAFFVVVVILPLLVGGIWTEIGVKKHFIKNIYAQNNLIADQLSDETDQMIKSKVDLVMTLANMPQIIKMDPAELKPLLKSVKEKNVDVDIIGIVNLAGMQIARSDNEKLVDIRDRSYFKDSVAGKDYAVSEVLISKSTQKPSLFVAAPIKDNGVIKGVIHFTLNLDKLGNLINSTKAGSTGFSFIVDSTGKVVAHPNQQYIAEQKDLTAIAPVREGIAGKTGTIEFSGEGKTWLASFTQTPFLKWAVVTQQPRDEAIAGANDVVRNTLVVLFLGAAFAVLMGIFLSNRIVKPIIMLNNEVLTMADGDLTKTVHSNQTMKSASWRSPLTR